MGGRCDECTWNANGGNQLGNERRGICDKARERIGSAPPVNNPQFCFQWERNLFLPKNRITRENHRPLYQCGSAQFRNVPSEEICIWHDFFELRFLDKSLFFFKKALLKEVGG